MFSNPFLKKGPDLFRDLTEDGCRPEEQPAFDPAPSVDGATAPTHFVNPHYVEGYVRQDGTYVEGYWRDGDNDTSVNRDVHDGGGYDRTNPDDFLYNNLG